MGVEAPATGVDKALAPDVIAPNNDEDCATGEDRASPWRAISERGGEYAAANVDGDDFRKIGVVHLPYCPSTIAPPPLLLSLFPASTAVSTERVATDPPPLLPPFENRT
eukprot:4093439-Ditylum_brightwellii.AAC.1